MNIAVCFNDKIKGTVSLPASKSISNRILILNALADSPLEIENLSDCDDTKSMLQVLQSDVNYFDIGHAGTAMRFLTAFLSRIVGIWDLTGSERMKQRPIGVLVDALNRLGAHIEYREQVGFPPLRIYGSYLRGGEISIPASVSSQYISALMMIAPYMAEGLRLSLTGKVVSRKYIDMTVALMRFFGAEIETNGDFIKIAPLPYTPVPFRVESDWSAASYFYELLAIAGGGEITLTGLEKESLQGDAGQVYVWEKLGVKSSWQGDKLMLRKKEVEIRFLEFNFVEMPDLVQSFAVACCMNGIPFSFSGVETLRIKETDRITALITELRKLGYELSTEGEGVLKWEGTLVLPEKNICIETYHDHRMAMAFAPAALKHPGMVIVDKEVVSKSFADYWKELQKLGLKIEEVK